MRLFRVKLIEYLQRYMKASKWNKQYNGQIHIKQWLKKKIKINKMKILSNTIIVQNNTNIQWKCFLFYIRHSTFLRRLLGDLYFTIVEKPHFQYLSTACIIRMSKNDPLFCSIVCFYMSYSLKPSDLC